MATATRSGIAARPSHPSTSRFTRAQREAIAFYLFLIPWLIGFVGFTVGPMIMSAVLALTRYDILSPPQWVGIANIRRMLLEDPLFWHSLRVTGVYTVVAVPLHVLAGYSIALLLNTRVRGLAFWRTVYYVPAVVPAVAASYMWIWLMNKDWGLINGLLLIVGIEGPGWVASEDWVIPSFIMMSLWGAGGGMVLYLAGLQQVPTTYYDAAKIDGANAWQRFRYITLPMTSFVIFFTVVTGLIGTFQIFTVGYLVSGGGPANASLFYVLYLYYKAWQDFEMGYASALAWFLFFLILAVTIVVLKASGRWVYYEEGG